VLSSFVCVRLCVRVGARPLFLTKTLSSTPANQAPVLGCPYSSCVLFMHVCLCMSLSICAIENVYLK